MVTENGVRVERKLKITVDASQDFGTIYFGPAPGYEVVGMIRREGWRGKLPFGLGEQRSTSIGTSMSLAEALEVANRQEARPGLTWVIKQCPHSDVGYY